MNLQKKFFTDVEGEMERARAKFPGSDKMIVAIQEELGELAQACLKITEDGDLPQSELLGKYQRVYDEAVQVAATAARLAIEGDLSMGYPGMKCHYKGCTQPAVGGPCGLCYE